MLLLAHVAERLEIDLAYRVTHCFARIVSKRLQFRLLVIGDIQFLLNLGHQQQHRTGAGPSGHPSKKPSRSAARSARSASRWAAAVTVIDPKTKSTPALMKFRRNMLYLSFNHGFSTAQGEPLRRVYDSQRPEHCSNFRHSAEFSANFFGYNPNFNRWKMEHRSSPQVSGKNTPSLMLAVTFDMDGLMFNTEDVYTLAGSELLSRRGRLFPPELKDAMMGRPPRAAFEAMIAWHQLPEPWDVLAAESNEIFLGLLKERLATMPGLLEFLAALEKAEIPKAIATSSGRRLTDACLAPFSLASRFRFILTSEDITRGKPDPEIYLLAAARFGVPPAEMLVLEDSQNGCRAAAASGAFTVAVPGEHSRRQDFSSADLVIASLTDRRLYELLGISP